LPIPSLMIKFKFFISLSIKIVVFQAAFVIRVL
jgi:hypothetical protein